MMNDRVLRSHATLHAVLGLLLVSAALPAEAALKLTVGEERTVVGSTMNYANSTVSVGVSNGYLLCANTAWGSGSAGAVSPIQISPQNGAFVFGTVNSAGGPISLTDVRSFNYSVQGDALIDINRASNPGTLGCFVTDQNASRVGAYNGLFQHGFETQSAAPSGCTAASTDSCVSISVLSLTASSTSTIYQYRIDFRLPEGSTSNYTLRDGFMSELFVDDDQWWCLQSPWTCGVGSTIDLNLTSKSPRSGQIIVERRSKPGVGPAALGAVTTPLVIAALFPDGPGLRKEQFLSDNVAAGTGAISDARPVFTPAQLPVQFTATKGTGMTVQAFEISDDTSESASAQLTASAVVRFGALGSSGPTLGNLPPSAVTVDCGTGVLAGQHSRTCSISFVPPAGFSEFATTNENGGVPAYITLTATDPLGQTTTTAPIPLVVTSNANSVPTYEVTPKLDDVGGTPTSTLTCRMSELVAGTNPTACGSSGVVSIGRFLSALRPGAADSLDEDLLQTTSVDLGSGGALTCSGDLAIFSGLGQPKLVGSSNYTLSYVFVGTGGVANCSVTVRDQLISGTFPAAPDPQQQRTSTFNVKIEFIDD